MSYKLYYDIYDPTNTNFVDFINARIVFRKTDNSTEDIVIKCLAPDQLDTITIQSTFTPAGNNSMASSLRDFYNNFRKSILTGGTGTLGAGVEIVKNAAALSNELKTSGNSEDSLFNKLNSKLTRSQSAMAKSLGSVVDLADDYIYVYEGSTISVPSTVNYVLLTSDTSVDIYKQLKTIIDLSIGDYKIIGGDAGAIAMQKPPNDYEPGFSLREYLSEESYRNLPKGSGTLYLGPYRYPGCVISSLTINISPVYVDIDGGLRRPLSITGTISLDFVVKFTKSMLMQNFNV